MSKKIGKQAVSVLMAICLLCAMLPTMAVANDTTGTPYAVTGGNIYFDAATGAITGCGAEVTAAVIPSTINGVAVTSIGEFAFDASSDLTSVTIPYGVTSIGDGAFAYCGSLASIAIPDSVTIIGEGAFMYCVSLISIAIPDSVTSIGNDAFSYCGLESVTISKNVTSIGNGTFSFCGLTSVTIPDGVTYIGANAFACCDDLTSVTIPNGVCYIGDRAFAGWPGSKGGSLASVTIPKSVTFIGDGAFADCNNLTDVYYTGSEKQWNAISFGGTDIFPANTTIHYEGTGSDDDENDGAIVLYPVTGGNIYFDKTTGTILDCDSGVTTAEIPDTINGVSVTTIGDSSFGDCTNLTSVTIPNSVMSIGGSAFSGTALTDLTIPNSVTSIGTYVFSDCKSLTSVIIPDSVTSIGEGMFNGCRSLTSVTIPDSVTSIGNFAFGFCSSLTSVTIPNSVTSIGNYAFSNCEGLTSVTMPKNLVSLGEDAFGRCGSLTGVTIPDNVTSISQGTFSECTSLTSVTIPDSITFIGVHAFERCSSLTDVYYGGTEAQWEGISIEGTNKPLTDATIHYNSTGPDNDVPATSTPTPTPTPGVEVNPFNDVGTNDYFYDAVQWAVEKGITNGYGTTDVYAPDIAVDRGQMAVYLWRLAGEPKPTITENPFTDISEVDYFYEAVLWALEMGITNGYGTTEVYAPGVTVDRSQMAVYLWRMYGQQTTTATNPFNDVSADSWYNNAVLWCVSKGITNGTNTEGTTYSPTGTVDRGQMAVYLFRAEGN